MSRVRIAREDLERLTSAATAFAAFQRVGQQGGVPLPDVHAWIDGAEVRLTAARLDADLAELEQAVIRTRRLLRWRR